MRSVFFQLGADDRAGERRVKRVIAVGARAICNLFSTYSSPPTLTIDPTYSNCSIDLLLL